LYAGDKYYQGDKAGLFMKRRMSIPIISKSKTE
jgi:hypothetical protein